MIRPDRLGLAGFAAMFLLALVFGALEGGGEPDGGSWRRPAPEAFAQPRRPAPAIPDEALPPPSPRDPAVRIAPGRKGNSTGTAFSIGDGAWMTARHVLDGCTTFGIVVGRRRAERGFDPVLSPSHDLAVFRAGRDAPALGFAAGELRRGQEAFHFGYPQGRPADVRSALLGRMRAIPAGRRHSEPVVAWAEAARAPRFSGSLGGMSGGPAVDANGDVVGVTVAESARRGRVFTSAPAGLRDMLVQAGARPRGPGGAAAGGPVDARGFAAAGQALRDGLTVAKVVCWVG